MCVIDSVMDKMQTIKKLILVLYKERGSILVLTAILLPVFLGCMGIAYDMGNIYMHKARLQNVADAAALAGARAYLDSQTDEIDDNTSTDKSTTYTVGSATVTRNYTEKKHQAANAAADIYILKNIINLENNVHADKYSHYALKSSESTTKTFYRIGLNETVPLYFLPIITDKRFQIIRAGAIAVMEPGTNGGGTSSSTLFDKLFVVNALLNASRNVLSNPDANATNNKISSINTTFDGEVIYTGNTWNAAPALIVQDNHDGLYLYTYEEQQFLADENNQYNTIHQINGIPNTGIRTVYDTSIDIHYYVPGFYDKLNRPHMEHSEYNFNISTNNMPTSTQGTVYSVTTTGDSPQTIYYTQREGNNYSSSSALYYNIGTNTYLKFLKGFPTYGAGVTLDTFVLDEDYNRIFMHINNNDFEFYRQKRTVGLQNYYGNQWGAQLSWSCEKLNVSVVSDNSTKREYSYTDNGQVKKFEIEKITANFPGTISTTPVDESVYYLHSGSGMTAALNVNGGLEGSESDPIFIIVSEGNPTINVTVSNDRPVIYCYLGTDEDVILTTSNGATFKGLIYAPYTGVQVQNGGGNNGGSKGHFEGNIIAEYIDIQGPGASFKQKNFIPANDNDLNTVPDTVAAAQATRKQQAITYAKQALASIGITDEIWNDKDWLKNNPDKVEQVQKAWYNVRLALWQTTGLDMPDWPWSTGGKTTDKNQHHYPIDSTGNQNNTGDETIRLTNYRTEYKEGDTIVNPFRALTLGPDLTY